MGLGNDREVVDALTGANQGICVVVRVHDHIAGRIRICNECHSTSVKAQDNPDLTQLEFDNHVPGLGGVGGDEAALVDHPVVDGQPPQDVLDRSLLDHIIAIGVRVELVRQAPVVSVKLLGGIPDSVPELNAAC